MLVKNSCAAITQERPPAGADHERGGAVVEVVEQAAGEHGDRSTGCRARACASPPRTFIASDRVATPISRRRRSDNASAPASLSFSGYRESLRRARVRAVTPQGEQIPRACPPDRQDPHAGQSSAPAGARRPPPAPPPCCGAAAPRRCAARRPRWHGRTSPTGAWFSALAQVLHGLEIARIPARPVLQPCAQRREPMDLPRIRARRAYGLRRGSCHLAASQRREQRVDQRYVLRIAVLGVTSWQCRTPPQFRRDAGSLPQCLVQPQRLTRDNRGHRSSLRGGKDGQARRFHRRACPDAGMPECRECRRPASVTPDA